MKQQVRFFVLRLVPALVLSACRCAFGNEYEVQGTISFNPVGTSLNAPTAMHREFHVWVKDCSWLIQTTQEHSKGEVVRWQIGSTNGFEIFQTTQVLKNGKVPHPTVGIVVSNSVPTDCSDPVLAHLWMMYASRCYLDRATNGYMIPLFSPVASVRFAKELAFKTDVVRQQDSLQLPSRIVFYNDGYSYSVKTNRELVRTPLPSPYNAGFTNAIYQATGLTNTAAGTFASGFKFEMYSPSFKGHSSSELTVRSVAMAQTTVIRDTCDQDVLLPEIKNRTVIVDQRLADAKTPTPVISYDTTPKKGWLTVKQAVEKQKIPHKQTRLFAWGLLALFITGAISLVLMARRGKGGSSSDAKANEN